MKRSVSGILSQVAAGRSNAVIGAMYGVKGATIEKDLTVIYSVLGCQATQAGLKRCEVVAIAMRRGIIR